MLDEGELRRRFPEIPWDQPVKIVIPGYEHLRAWACRYCIAMNGLSAQEIIHGQRPEAIYHGRDDALAHIEAAHHD